MLKSSERHTGGDVPSSCILLEAVVLDSSEQSILAVVDESVVSRRRFSAAHAIACVARSLRCSSHSHDDDDEEEELSKNDNPVSELDERELDENDISCIDDNDSNNDSDDKD